MLSVWPRGWAEWLLVASCGNEDICDPKQTCCLPLISGFNCTSSACAGGRWSISVTTWLRLACLWAYHCQENWLPHAPDSWPQLVPGAAAVSPGNLEMHVLWPHPRNLGGGTHHVRFSQPSRLEFEKLWMDSQNPALGLQLSPPLWHSGAQGVSDSLQLSS